MISIHAPREGSDIYKIGCCPRVARISIHAPREGSDVNAITGGQVDVQFLSTLPVRGATLLSSSSWV